LAVTLATPGQVHADAAIHHHGLPTQIGAAKSTDFMHARYYSPNLGRFMSVDPVQGKVGSSQSWNRYSYVLNNPVGLVDPDGEQVAAPMMTPYGPIPMPIVVPPPQQGATNSDLPTRWSAESLEHILLTAAVGLTALYQGAFNENTADADDEIIIDGMTEDDLYDLQDELSGEESDRFTSREDHRSQQRLVRELADEYGVDENDLTAAIHDEKGSEGREGDNNLTPSRIRELAKRLASE
jgi:RHS repeat-associated protein